MKKNIIVISVLFCSISLYSQDYTFRKNVDKDSLFNASIKKLPLENRKEYIKMYKNANDKMKEFFLFMISMPESSKKELIQNFENRKVKIEKLKNEYEKFVPKNHIVEIEFEPASKILNVPDQLSIKIFKKIKNGENTTGSNEVKISNNFEVVSQNWNLQYDSKELDEVLKYLGWKNETLSEIKTLLTNANCISIENGEFTTIGFARGGMAKYSYKIFDNSLTEKQKSEYNDGCLNIYYKENIVLEYGGGAIGPQCFEKE